MLPLKSNSFCFLEKSYYLLLDDLVVCFWLLKLFRIFTRVFFIFFKLNTILEIKAIPATSNIGFATVTTGVTVWTTVCVTWLYINDLFLIILMDILSTVFWVNFYSSASVLISTTTFSWEFWLLSPSSQNTVHRCKRISNNKKKKK